MFVAVPPIISRRNPNIEDGTRRSGRDVVFVFDVTLTLIRRILLLLQINIDGEVKVRRGRAAVKASMDMSSKLFLWYFDANSNRPNWFSAHQLNFLFFGIWVNSYTLYIENCTAVGIIIIIFSLT